MPTLPPRAIFAGSDMTRLWCLRAQFDGRLKKAHTNFLTTSSTHTLEALSSTPLSSPSSSPSSTTATLQHQSANFKSKVVKPHDNQVRKLPGRSVILLFLVLILIPESAMSRPWSKMQPTEITFQSRICQIVSATDLQKRMGPYFDKSRMASESATSKRTFDPTFEDSGNAGYQGDEPGIGLAFDHADFLEDVEEPYPDSDVWVKAREEDIYSENGVIEEIDGSEFVERRNSIPGKKAINRRVPERIRKVVTSNYRRSKPEDGQVDPTDNVRQTVFSDPYLYMKRRRRSVLDNDPSSRLINPLVDNPSDDEDESESMNAKDDDNEEGDCDTGRKNKKSVGIVPLQLMVRENNKTMRKYYKKKLRQRVINTNKPPPWECKFIQVHKHMRKGIFPDFLLEGRCQSSKCFYNIYNCEPIKYAVKLLQRDPDQCNPLPTVSNITVYEERWNLVQYHVTVGCNCASPSAKTSRPKNRRRD